MIVPVCYRGAFIYVVVRVEEECTYFTFRVIDPTGSSEFVSPQTFRTLELAQKAGKLKVDGWYKQLSAHLNS